jgi:hypothetical protein
MSNEPVAVNGAIAIVTAALTPILLQFGLSSTDAAQVCGLVGAAITGAVSVYSLIRARSKVTPVKGS